MPYAGLRPAPVNAKGRLRSQVNRPGPTTLGSMARLLLIEDDATIRTPLMRALKERGHAVASVATAMEGVRAALTDRPDLVVLDLGLPDLDGREVLRMLRAVSQVAVIVATARDDETEIVRVLDAGADDYVVK